MNDSLVHFVSSNLIRFSSFGPNFYVYEADKEALAYAILLEFEPEEVKLGINDNVLQISGESKRDNQYEESQVKISERPFGKFNRSIQLINGSDAENIKTKFNNAVLKI